MRVAVQAGRLTVEEVRNFVDGEIQPFTLGVLEGGTDSDDFEHRAESLLNPLAHLVEVVGVRTRCVFMHDKYWLSDDVSSVVSNGDRSVLQCVIVCF